MLFSQTPRNFARPSRWWLGLALCVLVMTLPQWVVLASWLAPTHDHWPHLRDYVLPQATTITVLLALGVVAGSLILGVPLAWLIARYRFAGHGLWRWALMLPLAMPAYVLAFVMVGLLDFSGPLQSQLRLWWPELRLPEIRSLGGAVVVLSLSFYPYVYLLARDAFASHSQQALEVAASLGLRPWQRWWRVVMPATRPALVAAALLVTMETLADFGAVSVFNLETLSVAIYKAWSGLFSLTAASQIAAVVVMLALLLMAIERWQRGQRRYSGSRSQPLAVTRLRGWRSALACALCALVWLLAFGLPLGQLLSWGWASAATDLDSRFPAFILNSLLLAALAAMLVVMLALLLAYGERQLQRPAASLLVQLSATGYAMPGAVLAVGFFIPMQWLDQQLLVVTGSSSPTLLKGTLLLILLGLATRFLSVGLAPLQAGLQRISPAQEMAAASLGVVGWRRLWRLHLPLLAPSITTAALLCFVDVMKEMPITLMTRPFGWDTLAVRVFEMTSEGEWQRAALPALAIVAAGLLPVVMLGRGRSQPS